MGLSEAGGAAAVDWVTVMVVVLPSAFCGTARDGPPGGPWTPPPLRCVIEAHSKKAGRSVFLGRLPTGVRWTTLAG